MQSSVRFGEVAGEVLRLCVIFEAPLHVPVRFGSGELSEAYRGQDVHGFYERADGDAPGDKLQLHSVYQAERSDAMWPLREQVRTPSPAGSGWV